MDKKQRTVAWLYPEMINKMESLKQENNMKNNSEFIEKAVDFYIGYLSSKHSTTYLSKIILSAMEATMKQTEYRHSNNIFRLSVEISMMMNILASGLEITDSQLEKLRARCIKEVKTTRGQVSFEDALSYQRGERK